MTKSEARQLDSEWKEMLQRHSKPLERGAVAKSVRVKLTEAPTIKQNPVRIKSLVTPGGSTALKAPNVYTGDKIVGIATLHKSCMQPVFSKQAAVDVAQMRRN